MADVLLLKKVPERPMELTPGLEAAADQVWSLLLRCWENDPKSRPDAGEVTREVRIPQSLRIQRRSF
jgi:hypothetical protein